jgi:hypothetical protein
MSLPLAFALRLAVIALTLVAARRAGLARRVAFVGSALAR